MATGLTGQSVLVIDAASGIGRAASSYATGAALVAAGLVSVLFFPAIALELLRGAPAQDPPAVVRPTGAGATGMNGGHLAGQAAAARNVLR